MKKILILALVALLVACGQGKTLDGTWVSSVDGSSITFKPNGMASVANKTHKFDETPYVIEGDKIKLYDADAYRLRLMPNGSISSIASGVLVKK